MQTHFGADRVHHIAGSEQQILVPDEDAPILADPRGCIRRVPFVPQVRERVVVAGDALALVGTVCAADGGACDLRAVLIRRAECAVVSLLVLARRLCEPKRVPHNDEDRAILAVGAGDVAREAGSECRQVRVLAVAQIRRVARMIGGAHPPLVLQATELVQRMLLRLGNQAGVGPVGRLPARASLAAVATERVKRKVCARVVEASNVELGQLRQVRQSDGTSCLTRPGVEKRRACAAEDGTELHARRSGRIARSLRRAGGPSEERDTRVWLTDMPPTQVHNVFTALRLSISLAYSD